MIECIDVSYSYHGDQEKATISCKGGTLKNINCKIENGTFVLLCGASGCGKTTLTRLFNGLIYAWEIRMRQTKKLKMLPLEADVIVLFVGWIMAMKLLLGAAVRSFPAAKGNV